MLDRFADAEPTHLAPAHQTFEVMKASLRGGFHVCQNERANPRKFLRERMENTVERFDLPFVSMSRRMRFVAERVESLRECECHLVAARARRRRYFAAPKISPELLQ